MNILVLRTGNSAQSIMLGSLLNDVGAGRPAAYSAGSQPAGRVTPQAVALLAAQGHDTSGFRSKCWDEFDTDTAPHMDGVITVCGSAAAGAAFSETYTIFKRGANAFLAAPLTTMDRAALRAHLRICGDIA